MDWGIVVAIVMLVMWGAGTVLEWGGWVAALLIGGVFLLIYGVVARGTGHGARGKKD